MTTPRPPRPEWEQLPTTVEGWGGHQTPGTVDTRPRRSPQDVLGSVLAKVRMGNHMTRPGEGIVPWSAMPRIVQQQASGALTTDTEAPIGFAPSDFTDPEERAIFERLVAVGLKEQGPAKQQAEQEAEAKMRRDAEMMARK